MSDKKKRLLIVDDSEIDREILNNILCEDFDIIEAENGYIGLEIILKQKDSLDAVILDVSMPVLDGFGVLRLMEENNINHLPVFLITAEATKDNVERAARYNVSTFIRKPFEREEILKRLKARTGFALRHDLKLSTIDLEETDKYISDLKAIYETYLTNFGKDSGHYVRISDLMKILLSKYYHLMDPQKDSIDRNQINVISKAAYFCDIGEMMIPNGPGFGIDQKDETGNDLSQSHTVLGADIVRLNYSRHCEYFVHICAEICAHHHERYDGKGFPHGIGGDNVSIYSQMCRLADVFDNVFYKYNQRNEVRFDVVLGELEKDKGAISQEIFSLLAECKSNIIFYYNNKV